MRIDIDAFLKKVVDLIYPRKCMFCAVNLTEEEQIRSKYICPECWDKINWQGWIQGQDRLGPQLARVDGVFAACEYTKELKTAMLMLKFYERDYFANGLAELMIKELKAYRDFFDVIVPVPISPQRLRERGYNQTSLIGVKVAEALGVDFNDTSLIRTKHTEKQSLSSGKQRELNIKGAFECDLEYFNGKRVFLMDDILTTGSTLAECVNTISKANTKKIFAGVIAIA